MQLLPNQNHYLEIIEAIQGLQTLPVVGEMQARNIVKWTVRPLLFTAIIIGLFLLFTDKPQDLRPRGAEPRTILLIRSSSEDLQPFELCSLYSTAIHNPRDTILLLTIFNTSYKLPEYFHGVKNIKQVTPSLGELFAQTPDEKWYHNREWDIVDNQVKRARLLSDAIRVAYLYKNGGIYMDTDIISLKPIPANLTNGVALQNPLESGHHQPLCNCFMVFEPRHPFLWAVMEEHAKQFDRKESENKFGVTLFSEVYRKMVVDSKKTVPQLYPVEKFIPIGYGNGEDLMQAPSGLSKNKIQKLENALTVHIWRNKLRSIFTQHPIPAKNTLLNDLMSENCAPVVKDFE